jgi:rubrerythrin
MTTEKRYIDVTDENIQAVLEKVPYYPDEIWKFTAMTERFQTVDAVEVVHGLWLDKTEVIVKPYYPPLDIPRVDCSVCGHIFWHTSALTYNYCPNCGAKMDGDENGI